MLLAPQTAAKSKYSPKVTLKKGILHMKEFGTLYPHFLHGADYNPDQWLSYPEVIEQDPG